MEADAADIAFADGAFTIAGTDRSMPIEQISFIPVGLPSELGVGLQGAGGFSPATPSFPSGCHICELELAPETGVLELDCYTVVENIGDELVSAPVVVVVMVVAQGEIAEFHCRLPPGRRCARLGVRRKCDPDILRIGLSRLQPKRV
jgi:hypothetical protein